MFVPRLVATDLDGTLLRSDLSISDRTLRTLARLEENGIHLVFVTGRPVRWLEPVLVQTGRRGEIVCANGALVIDGESGDVLRSCPIPAGTLRELTGALREAVPGVVFAAERGLFMVREREYPVRHDLGRPDEAIVEYDEVVAEPVEKLLVRAPDVDPSEFWATCRPLIDGMATATHSGFSGLIEVSAAGVTKATGLAWVAERCGVDRDSIVAFGDMPNDIPMLAWVGRGVVVADAHPDAAAVAHTVTTGNDADGVATYLDALLDEVEAAARR